MQTKIIQWDFDAWEDYLYWQSQDIKGREEPSFFITLEVCLKSSIENFTIDIPELLPYNYQW